MKQNFLECGKIINIHGFRGTVKLESWCDSPAVLSKLPALWFRKNDGTYESRRVLHASVFRSFVLADLEGITDEQRAKALCNTVVFASREDLPLPKGGCFLVDLIGLEVKDADTGAHLGEVADVDRRGAQDLYLIRTETGTYPVPAVKAFVIKVDPDDALYLRPIPGLLDGGAEQI